MIPDFNKKTVDTVAKRAGFICSNPDCRIKTVGPNTSPDKSTIIGEAAHIYGARPNSKRYFPVMTDSARAEITNAIWLCRNCHKLIDGDEKKYTSELMFSWRELHEEYVLSELGNNTALIENEQLQLVLNQFKGYPAIIRRIVRDKPVGWEYRLTAELLRFLNEPGLRKLKDLNNNLYLKPQRHISENQAFNWITQRLTELTKLVNPLVQLIEQLNASWGATGHEGDVEEIHHICKLIRGYVEQIIEYEEFLRFANVPEKYQKLKLLLENRIGSQVLKLESIPGKLDAAVDLAIDANNSSQDTDEPKVIRETLTFGLPKNWESEFDKELRKVRRLDFRGQNLNTNSNKNSGCLTIFVALFIIYFLVLVI